MTSTDYVPALAKLSYAYYVNPAIVLCGGIVVSAFAAIILILGIWRMYRYVKPSLGEVRANLIKAFFYTLIDEFLIHRNLGRCKPEWGRWILHQMVLWGMVILVACTGYDAIAEHEEMLACGEVAGPVSLPLWFLKGLGLSQTALNPYYACATLMHPLTDPVKIFYNVGAALLVIGTVGLLVRRFVNRYARECVIEYDWYLLILLTIVAVSGILAEALRLIAVHVFYMYGSITSGLAAALPIFYAGLVFYCIHLASVTVLFVTIPFTKSAHVVYRFIAMLLVRYRGVKKVEVQL